METKEIKIGDLVLFKEKGYYYTVGFIMKIDEKKFTLSHESHNIWVDRWLGGRYVYIKEIESFKILEGLK